MAAATGGGDDDDDDQLVSLTASRRRDIDGPISVDSLWHSNGKGKGLRHVLNVCYSVHMCVCWCVAFS